MGQGGPNGKHIIRESSVLRELQWCGLIFSHSYSCSKTMCLDGAIHLGWVAFHPCFSNQARLQFSVHSWSLADLNSKPIFRKLVKGGEKKKITGLLSEANSFGEISD